MIPRNIKREHIIKAIEEIESRGIPKGRRSKKFVLEHNHKHYPPKYIISLANKYVNDQELASLAFNGGYETNNFLKALGFRIVDISSSDKPINSSDKINKIVRSKITHNERCPECKEIIKKFLEKIYGKVESNYKFKVGIHPEDFRDSKYYWNLKKIYESLQSHRDFKEFAKAKTLPSCDFFIPNPGFIVEFDESQHFTMPRKITLKHYPEELKLRFIREKWVMQCEEINAKDNDPPYRDEQRAWYDTLRDFLSEVIGLEPTVRLLARDFKWCSLDPNNQTHISRFKDFLKEEIEEWRFEVKEDPYPFLARIVTAGKWEGRVEKAKKLLNDVYNYWPKGKKVKFIVTCGGFIQFEWPKLLSLMDIGNNKYPNSEVVNLLVEEAKKYARFVLDDDLKKKLSGLTDFVTLGIDSRKEKISTTKNFISQPHIELVILADLKENKYYWTGKSYPTPSQEKGLVRISDLKSHFFDLKEEGKTMILGCHDLSIFNNRNWNRTGEWRKGIKIEFRNLAEQEKPTCVLHHPHTTVKKLTWFNAWNQLKTMLPSVTRYIGSGVYYEPDREYSEYDSIDKVLESTKFGKSIDIIVWGIHK